MAKMIVGFAIKPNSTEGDDIHRSMRKRRGIGEKGGRSVIPGGRNTVCRRRHTANGSSI